MWAVLDQSIRSTPYPRSTIRTWFRGNTPVVPDSVDTLIPYFDLYLVYRSLITLLVLYIL